MSNEIKSETTLTLKTAIAEIGKTSPITLSLLLSKENDCRLEISGEGYNLFIYGLENLGQLICDLERLQGKWWDYENADKVISVPIRYAFGEATIHDPRTVYRECVGTREQSAGGQLCQCRECKD